MSNLRYSRGLGASALAALALTSGAASAATTDYIDLEAGAGYSTNPFLSIPSRAAGFGRISANGVHSWSSERGTTSLTGYIENTTYFRKYGSRQIFDLGAHTRQALNPTVTVFGNLDFSGDFAGQLSNRLITVPSQPPVIEPGSPLPPPSNTPDVFNFSGRQYRLSGDLGASIRSGARGTVSLSAGAQRSWFPGNRDADYNSYFGSAGYSQQISERTSAGASLSFTRQDFTHGDWANIINPALTVNTQLSESVNASAAVGLLAIEDKTDDHKDHRVTPSVSASICQTSTLSRLCAHVSRDAQSALSARVVNGGGGASITTSAGIDYYRRLSEAETIQAALSASRYESSNSINNNNRLRTTYISGVVGYDRKIRNRLYAGVQGGVRKLFQVGPDPKLDLNANVYLRYRLGDLL